MPTDALYFDNGDAYVYLAEDGAAQRTPVDLSLYTAEQTAITGGAITPHGGPSAVGVAGFAQKE